MEKTTGPNQFMALVGGVLAMLGLAVCATLRISSFARYMWLEDLGLDVDPAVSPELFMQLVAMTPTDKAMFYIALAMIPIGLALMTVAVLKHKRTGRNSAECFPND